ncbi:MAG: sensor histidine kinase [Alkalispirochaetaceae bacterium]
MMLRLLRPTTTSRTSLISLVLLYLVLLVLVLAFARTIIADFTLARGASQIAVLALAVGFPMFLLFMIGINVLRLIRDRRRRRPGVGLKLRLSLFFLFVVLLSAVPQGVLSVSFLNAVMRTWFSAETGQALRGGLDVALEYYDEQVERLEQLGETRFFESRLRTAHLDPDSFWEELISYDPQLDGFQLFREGESAATLGEEELILSWPEAQTLRTGFVSRASARDVSLLRYRAAYVAEGVRYDLIVSRRMPTGFNQAAQDLTRSIETFNQLERLRSLFVLAVSVLYGVFAFPLILIAILVSFLLAEELMRPVANLEEATRRVAEGDFSVRIMTRASDDLGILVLSFNRMVIELERNRKKLVQTEKIAAWQEIAQRLAHEIKNPLTPIRLAAERLRRRYQAGDSDFRETLDRSVNVIVREVETLSDLLSEFRSFSTLPAPRMEEFALRELLDEVRGSYESYHEITIEIPDLDPEITVSGDRRQLKQVFSNLFQNAIDAMEGSGRIVVRSDVVKKGESSYCRVQVEDNGPGIASDHQGEVFNPYYTTKPHGTGLGLAIVERIMFDHQGQIWFETESGVGTTFFLDIPRGSG